MVFTQCSILNRDSPLVRQRTVRIELHLGGNIRYGGLALIYTI